MNTYEGRIYNLKKDEIFVFGSNTEGRHGKGSALIALRKFGAIYGQAKGLQGNSYGIITKDLTKKTHPSISKIFIVKQVFELYQFALQNPHLKFYVAYSGTDKNLNGYTPSEMSGLFTFSIIPENIVFEKEFYKLILKNKL